MGKQKKETQVEVAQPTDSRVVTDISWDSDERGQYDWATLLDGQARRLTRGEEGQEGHDGIDYTCKDLTFATLARNAARRKGKTIRTKSQEGGMILQAFEASDEQKEAWAEQDAAREIRKTEKKEAAKAEKAAEALGTAEASE